VARPAKGYYAADGKRVPGVSAITGRFKDAGGLIRWAWRMGQEGRDIDRERDAAATAGTIAHDLIECRILGRDYTAPPDTDPELLTLARQAFEGFEEWWQTHAIEVVATETPLVSETHRYGGTPDAVGMVGGKRVLLDWKTSNRIYPEYVMQTSAYVHLWEERQLEPIDSTYLLRVGKEYGDFHAHYFPRPVVMVGWEAFVHARALYDLDKQLKKVV